jgi:lipopolysaccharide exporter
VLKKLFLQSDLFVTVFCFGSGILIKLVSSVILTQILAPEDYGIIIMLMSIAIFIELISDLGIYTVLVRHARGDDQAFINTMWTIRLIRNMINFSILFLFAPLIAKLYSTPQLTSVLRIFAFCLVIHSFESMSFVLAARHKKVRIVSYMDLAANLVTVPFVIVYTRYSRDAYGMLYGMLLYRLIMALASHLFFTTKRPRFQLEPEARKDLFEFSKITIPSSMMAIIAMQFDKIIFLKLFDLRLFGIYGVAGGLAGPITGLGEQISRSVLYPRCADYVRTDRRTSHLRYYHENIKIFALISTLPAIAAGATDFIVQLLYDERYAYAAVILQAFLGRSIISSLLIAAEQFLLATGASRVIAVNTALRLCWVVPACLLGYYFYGFSGFLYAGMLEPLLPLIYVWSLQYKQGMLIVRYECYKIAFIASVFITSLIINSQISGLAVRQFIKSFF